MKAVFDDTIKVCLARAIVSTPVGHFLQIERRGRQHARSLLAARFTGDIESFTREVKRMCLDTLEGVKGGQMIIIKVTEN